MAVGTPVIISVTIGAVLVLSVALVTIVRWASTKPSTQLPPPRSAALLSPYWANQQRYSTHFGGPVDVYDEERKLTGKGSGVFNPYADYSTSNVSDSSLYRGTKTPDGDRTPNSGVSFGHENVGPQSEQHHLTPPLHPNELGEISLNSPNPPRQRPTSLQFVNGSPAARPTGNFGPNGSTTTVGGGAQQAAATDPQNVLPPSAFSHMHPSPPRPFSTSSRSRHSIAGPPPAIAQPPPSFYQTKQDRRASRMSMLSTYSSSGYTYDPRRSSVTSMIRGPPHKSNMQIVLPAPLAATAAPAPGIGFPGNNNFGNAHDAEDSAFRRNQRRHSRVDLWTETNNIARSKSPLADLSAAADSGSRSNRRPSLGSEKSGRSLELANSGQFMHMQPPPPLPAASSRSLLTSSPTPNSSSSALPPMSSAMTTPQLSTEIVHEKHASSSDAHSTSTSNNAVPVDDSKPPPPPPQPQNVVKSDDLPIIPSLPAIEPTKDI